MVFEWDNFFNAVLTSVEDKTQAADEAKPPFSGSSRTARFRTPGHPPYRRPTARSLLSEPI